MHRWPGRCAPAQVAVDGLSSEHARVPGQLAPGVSLWNDRQMDQQMGWNLPK